MIRFLRNSSINPAGTITHNAAWIIYFFKQLSARDLHSAITQSTGNAYSLQQALFRLSGAQACAEQERLLRVWLIRKAKDPSFVIPLFLTAPLMKQRMEDTESSLLHKIYCSLIICNMAHSNSTENKIKQTFITTVSQWSNKVHADARYYFYNAIAPLVLNRTHIAPIVEPQTFEDIGTLYNNHDITALTPLYTKDEINNIIQYTQHFNRYRIRTPANLAILAAEFYSDKQIGALVKFITDFPMSEMTEYFIKFMYAFMTESMSRLTPEHLAAINNWIVKCTAILNLPAEHHHYIINIIEASTKDNPSIIYNALKEIICSTKPNTLQNKSIDQRTSLYMLNIAKNHGIADKALIDFFISHVGGGNYFTHFFDLLMHAKWEQDELKAINTQLEAQLKNLTPQQTTTFTRIAARSFLESKSKKPKENLKHILLNIKDVASINEPQIIEAIYTPGYSDNDIQDEIKSLLSIFIASDKTTHIERGCGILSAIIKAAPLEAFKQIDIQPFIAAMKVCLEEEEASSSIHALACEALAAFIPHYNDAEFVQAVQIIIDFHNQPTYNKTSFSAADTALTCFTKRTDKIDSDIRNMISSDTNLFMTLECITLLLAVAVENDPALEKFLNRFPDKKQSKPLFHSIILLLEKFSQDHIPRLLKMIFEKLGKAIYPSSEQIELLTGILTSKSICTTGQKVIVFQQICKIANESIHFATDFSFIAEKALPHILANGLDPVALTRCMLTKEDDLERLAIELVSAAYVAVGARVTAEEANTASNTHRTNTL